MLQVSASRVRAVPVRALPRFAGKRRSPVTAVTTCRAPRTPIPIPYPARGTADSAEASPPRRHGSRAARKAGSSARGREHPGHTARRAGPGALRPPPAHWRAGAAAPRRSLCRPRLAVQRPRVSTRDETAGPAVHAGTRSSHDVRLNARGGGLGGGPRCTPGIVVPTTPAQRARGTAGERPALHTGTRSFHDARFSARGALPESGRVAHRDSQSLTGICSTAARGACRDSEFNDPRLRRRTQGCGAAVHAGPLHSQGKQRGNPVPAGPSRTRLVPLNLRFPPHLLNPAWACLHQGPRAHARGVT